MPVLEAAQPVQVPARHPAAHRAYRAYGAAAEVLAFRGREVVMSGPAGTGKTRANLEKLFAVANKYPGCRLLLVRKTRASLTQSVLVTWEEKVVPQGHPCLKGPTREHRKEYRFPNGSVVAVGGLDEPSRILSTEWDVIYVAEAIELTETDWETLTTRLRNGVVPYQQIIADTNPDSPRHWLYQRVQTGKCVMLESRHEDNPAYYDSLTKQLTPLGAAYIGGLENLTGVRKQRYGHGRWVQAEGVVYEEWDASIHRIYRKDLPAGWELWPRLWVNDFGYNDPFVWQEWIVGPDSCLYRLREIYRSKTLVEDNAKDILADSGYRMNYDSSGKPTGAREPIPGVKQLPLPTAIICDHDAEGRATLLRHLGMDNIPAFKSIKAGIQAVAARLRPQEDGLGNKKPRLYFVRDALIHPPDPVLMEKKLPTCTEDEFDSYVWDTTAGKAVKETPVDKDNHGMDAARYLVAYYDKINLQASTVRFRGL